MTSTTPSPQTTDALHLPSDLRSPHAVKQIEAFHQDYLEEVKRLVATHDIVVVGMGMNPVVKKAKRLLDTANLPYAYIGHGSYLSGYRRRLAVKLWSGWPWFPQVFVKGVLIGGARDLEAELSHGIVQKRLAAPRGTAVA